MSENDNEVKLPDFIMVNPRLEVDAANKQGEIGVITAAILNTDEFFVGFDDKEVGLYSADALLTFIPSEQIYLELKRNAMQLNPPTFKDLKNIALLLDYGTARQQRTAMEIAKKNPFVIATALISLDKSLGLTQTHTRGR